jgi:hypothetical protein
MGILEKIIAVIESAKSDVLKKVVEDIEGRPADVSDFENIVLARYSFLKSPNRQMVVYKDVHVGYIDIDMVERCVIFTPK